jgi:peptidoglycan/xylan/chitin deacetylase (PgdA/CDA1 family)
VIAGYRRARSMMRRAVTRRGQRAGVVLLYHRVAELVPDPQLLAVGSERFARQLAALRRHAALIGLDEMQHLAQRRRLPRRPVAVTFDDGYADNLHAAKPILEQHSCPATVFVASDYVDGATEFWWDELERLVLLPGTLPEQLTLAVGGIACRWNLGIDATYTSEQAVLYGAWNVLSPDDPTRRHGLYRTLHRALRPLTTDRQWSVLSVLQAQARHTAPPRASHAVLSARDVRALAAGGRIDIGGHTSSHPVLAATPLAVQRREIGNSKQRLEEIIGRRLTAFSYPYGSVADYTAETVAEVRNAGYSIACSNFEGTVGESTSWLETPRMIVRDWSADELMMQLQRFWN